MFGGACHSIDVYPVLEKQEQAQAALVEAIAQELINLGFRPATTASYIRRASDEPMKLVAPETWATMRELLSNAAAVKCE